MENETRMDQKLKKIVFLNFVLIVILGISPWLIDSFLTKFWGAILIICIVTAIVLLRIYEEKERNKTAMNLAAEKMELLLTNIYYFMEFQSCESVIMVIHKKISNTHYKSFTKVINYGGIRKADLRIHEIEKGIVRLAFNRASGRSVFHDSFFDDNEKRKKLKDYYNYKDDEIEKMIEDGRRSYYCRTIVDEDKIWGVFYMASNKYNGFYDEHGQIQKNMDDIIRRTIEVIQNEVL